MTNYKIEFVASMPVHHSGWYKFDGTQDDAMESFKEVLSQQGIEEYMITLFEETDEQIPEEYVQEEAELNAPSTDTLQ